MRTARRTVGWWMALAAFVALAPSTFRATGQPPLAPSAALYDLEGVSGLQRLFDRETDKVRVVLLLSPT